ncbi:MAG: radical SAM protein [Candidatus Woesearchaeota archaeon]
MRPGVKLVFYRTLYSQSAASVTMGTVCSLLREKGIDAELCLLKRDQNLRNEIGICKKLFKGSEQYQVVIAKPNFKDNTLMLPLLKEAKDKRIFRRVFLCGPLATLNAESIMDNNGWLDGIILGYPEETACELVSSMTESFSWNLKCKGGLWRNPQDKTVCSPGPREQKIQLDQLPFPSRDIEKSENAAYVNMEASRGCAQGCSYCHIPPYSGMCHAKGRMVKSPKRVVDEIEILNKELKKTLFIFNDSHFWKDETDDSRILDFCEEIKKRNLDIKFYIYLRCNPSPNEKVINALSDAGLARAFLGLENASKESLRIYNKNLRPEDFLKIRERFEKRNINVHIGYIVFNPYSTLNDIKTNIDFLYKINKILRIGVILEQVRAVPCTSFYSKLVQDGILDPKLRYDKITYGYKYLHPKVNNLFKAIQKMFLEKLNNLGYYVEYYCVSGHLLKSLVLKENKDNIRGIKDELSEFEEGCKICQETMYGFFSKAIGLASKGKSPEEISDNKEFIKNYRLAALKLEVAWGKFVEKSRKVAGKRVIDEIFRGVE